MGQWHPIWIVAIMIAGTPLICFLCYFMLCLSNGDEMRLPFIVKRYGPKHCPHCGKKIEHQPLRES